MKLGLVAMVLLAGCSGGLGFTFSERGTAEAGGGDAPNEGTKEGTKAPHVDAGVGASDAGKPDVARPPFLDSGADSFVEASTDAPLEDASADSPADAVVDVCAKDYDETYLVLCRYAGHLDTFYSINPACPSIPVSCPFSGYAPSDGGPSYKLYCCTLP